MAKSERVQSKAFVVGLALFSMFFGSGNLIFPLVVGRVVGDNILSGALGFIFTAVLVPFMGVVAMIAYDGDYRRFFSCLGQRTGFVLTLVLLSFWIPLGSGPRCITLSFASISPFAPQLPLWVFGLGYSLLVFALSYKKGQMIDLLGYVLTPILLACIAFLVYRGATLSPGLANTGISPDNSFKKGLLEGYNTMDLIASFFFSSTIIGILKDREDPILVNTPDRAYISLAFRSGLIGTAILGSVYLGLMYVAASHSPASSLVPKEGLLSHLAFVLMGPELGFVASLAIALACLTTSVALASVFSDFLREKCFSGRVSHGVSLALTCLISYMMSTLGFKTVASMSEPVFQLFYPFLIVMILMLVPLKMIRARRRRLEAAGPGRVIC